MRLLSIAFSLSLILSGCASSIDVRSSEDARKFLEHRSGAVSLANGERYQAENIQVSGDSVTMTVTGGRESKTLHYGDIAAVEVAETRHRIVGGMEGAIIGFAVAEGMAHVFMDIDAERERFYTPAEAESNHGLEHFISSGGTILLGTLIGAGTGGAVGAREVYVFHPDSLGFTQHAAENAPRAFTYEQHAMKTIVRAGLGIGNYLMPNHDGPSTFTYGISSGIGIMTWPSRQLVLGFDLGCTRMAASRTSVLHEGVNVYDHTPYRFEFDENYQFTFIEWGIAPQYHFLINEDLTGCVSAGVSMGYGAQHAEYLPTQRAVADPANYQTNEYWYHNLYDATPPRIKPYGINFGASVFFHRLMLDLRYKSVNLSREPSYVRTTSDIFVQLGFVL